MGSVFLVVEILLALWVYRVVTKRDSDSLSSSLQQKQHQRQQHQTNSNNNNNNNNHRNRNRNRSPDGLFNGFPVYYHDLALNKTYHSRPYSSVSCVGENYQGDDFAWMHRSCHFRFLCFNVKEKEFEIYARPDDEILQSIANRRQPFMDLTASVIPPPRNRNRNSDEKYNDNDTGIGDGVSLGSGTVRHPKDKDNHDKDRDHRRRIKATFNWFPTVIRSSPPERYYALEEDLVFVPFHSMLVEEEEKERSKKNHSVVWDDLFPIYTLLNMFQLVSPNDHKEALLMRYVPSEESSMSSNAGLADSESKNLNNNDDEHDQSSLQRMMDRFRPLMMRRGNDDEILGRSRSRSQRLERTNWTTQVNAILSSSSQQQQVLHLRSELVCARDGVAGLGPHGIRKTKETNVNVNALHNYGKGGLLWMFRNYCLDNLGLVSPPSSVNRGDRPEKNDIDKTTSSTIRIILSASASAYLYSIAPRDGDETIMGQTKNNDIVDYFTPLEIGLRDFLSSADRESSVNDENVIIANKNHHNADTTTRVEIEIESHDFSNDTMNLTDRIKLMMDSTVFITVCSEAAATAATFLPRGASLIVFYDNNDDKNEIDGRTAVRVANGWTTNNSSSSGSASEPACLDYRDLLNNLSYVRVHWLPMDTIHSEQDRNVLFDLVKHEITIQKR